eukprot:scaffold1199_cov265-Pinguiococcus_pyrenoidosus.AAC.32
MLVDVRVILPRTPGLSAGSTFITMKVSIFRSLPSASMAQFSSTFVGVTSESSESRCGDVAADIGDAEGAGSDVRSVSRSSSNSSRLQSPGAAGSNPFTALAGTLGMSCTSSWAAASLSGSLYAAES